MEILNIKNRLGLIVKDLYNNYGYSEKIAMPYNFTKEDINYLKGEISKNENDDLNSIEKVILKIAEVITTDTLLYSLYEKESLSPYFVEIMKCACLVYNSTNQGTVQLKGKELFVISTMDILMVLGKELEESYGINLFTPDILDLLPEQYKDYVKRSMLFFYKKEGI